MSRDLHQNIFQLYFRVAENGFYTDAEKKRILRLISSATGCETGEIRQLQKAITEMNREELVDSTRCRNFLLIAQFANDINPVLLSAVRALDNYYEKNPDEPAYMGRDHWIRALRDAEPWRQGFYRYAIGEPAKAICFFEDSLRDNLNVLPIYEFLCMIALDQNDKKKALEYAIRARTEGENGAGWLKALEKTLEGQLTKEELEEVRMVLCYDIVSAFRIGF